MNPPSKPLTVEAKIVAKKQLTHDVIELKFESVPAFSFKPGQFISLVIPGKGPGGRDIRRAYSIASRPESAGFELCIKIVKGGVGTPWLDSLSVGQSVKGTAPFGDFVWKTAPERHAVFVATGTGIAPFRAMIFSDAFKAHPPRSATLVFGARDVQDLLYTDDFAQAIGPSRVVQALSRPQSEWSGFKGRVTDWLRAHESELDFAATDFYLCGNGAMIQEVKDWLATKGLDKTSVFQEAYYK